MHMPTSYIVMAGEYSDRHVCGVYTTKENADYAADLFGGWVEEFVPDAIPDHPQGMICYHVSMRRDGEATTQKIGIEGMDIYGKGTFLDQYFRKEDGTLTGVKEFTIGVWARDEQHAVKIVNEKRAQIIAANEWPDDPPPIPPENTACAFTGLSHAAITATELGDPIL